MSDPARVLRVSLPGALALARHPPPGNLAAPILESADVEVELYAPVGRDAQQPHTRDELYVGASGHGWLQAAGERHEVVPGTLLFVPAGHAHHFADFSADFAVWVFFYGPEGGSGAARLGLQPHA